MPTYQAICDNCRTYVEYFQPVSKCLETPECCGEPTRKVIVTAPMGMVFGRFEPFKSPIDGSVISTNRELKEHNSRNNVINVADGYSRERVLSGDYGKQHTLDQSERKHDVAEAIQKLNAGYKPDRSADHVSELDD